MYSVMQSDLDSFCVTPFWIPLQWHRGTKTAVYTKYIGLVKNVGFITESHVIDMLRRHHRKNCFDLIASHCSSLIR